VPRSAARALFVDEGAHLAARWVRIAMVWAYPKDCQIGPRSSVTGRFKRVPFRDTSARRTLLARTRYDHLLANVRVLIEIDRRGPNRDREHESRRASPLPTRC
jgi:hypothetical protein